MTNLSFLKVSFHRQKHMNTALYVLPRKVVSVHVQQGTWGRWEIFNSTQHPAPFFYANQGSLARCKVAKKYSWLLTSMKCRS